MVKNRRVFVCAGVSEEFDFATSIGVGLVESAGRLSLLLNSLGGGLEEVVFVGSCGFYIRGDKEAEKLPKLLEVFEVFHAANLEASGVLNLAYSPLLAPLKEFGSKANGGKNSTSQQASKSPQIPYNTINSSNFITTDEGLSKLFANHFLGENMELYAVGQIAQMFKLKWRGVMCGTNFCDKNARKTYLANLAAAKENLLKYLKENFF